MYDEIVKLIDLFLPHCSEATTLKELRDIAIDNNRWNEAHDLFVIIRHKTDKSSGALEKQYLFEEICAKSLYNTYCYSHDIEDPFDPDSPFWILPLALRLGKEIGFNKPEEISELLVI